MTEKNHYETLGVARSATAADIRAAYRRLVLELHPDRNHEADATEHFVRVGRAYEALSDPLRRASYDRILAMEEGKPRARRPAPQPKTHHAPPPPRRVPPPSADTLRAVQFLRQGRFAQAEQLAKRAIMTAPLEPIPYAIVGDVARVRGQYDTAAKYYAFAAQMDPQNPVYQRKHEEMTLADQRIEIAQPGDVLGFPVFVGAGITLVTAAAVVLVNDKPVLGKPVESWTVTLVVMLFIAGVAMGACLTLGRFLDRFWVAQGSAMGRVPPTLLLGVVALVNYWAAAALYIGVGAAQNAFQASTTRILIAVAVVTFLMTGAATLSGIKPGETLLWGGNLVYLGALCGWMVADGFRRPA
ncbi:MAG TPA: J domain-containing protein [Fimbriimonadaceae bacterium]|nr:J domain-containing protein [Fimbriimonadaceae bacterium]